jgi:hypothetical protein
MQHGIRWEIGELALTMHPANRPEENLATTFRHTVQDSKGSHL